MSIQDLISAKKDEILRVAESYGARNVRLFGSVARGEDSPQSDIDFLVSLDNGRSLLDHAGLMLALQELLERPVDVATERGLKPKFRERILKEAIAI